MNRKQRRALRHRGAKPPLASTANTTSNETLTSRAEMHSKLGAALMAQNKASEAIPHFEHVIALKPNLPGGYEDLAKACLAVGQLRSAIGAASHALALHETAQTKTLFAQCVREARFTADDGRIRKLMLRALSEIWDRPRELAGACISLIKLDAVVYGSIARANSAWPARLPATELLGSSIALSRDELLCRLLECTPITDVGIERLLTNVRLAMLTGSSTDGRDEHLLSFYCSVARQCFINQYVFSMTEVETDQVKRLRASLETALATGDPCPELWPAIVGAYFPLHTLSKADALLDRSWPACVGALLVQQVKEPAEERRIAAGIPVLTSIEGEVSRAVRQQYEESPYPRWVHTAPPGQPIILNHRRPERGFDVLFAGCGTGLSTVEFARQTPRARVLAVDLSLASLCYAQRMARSYRLTNVEFGQADIMKLEMIGREFDYVDASGVLHHLADPWEGWRILLSLLRPGGVMLVGLYSELARQGIVAAARRLIADRGYRPIPEDIRRCREEVMAAEDGSLLKSAIYWNDFFATSECRDLLFHVQEHHITLREIKLFVAATGVQFGGFMLDALTFQRFATRFPEPAAMTNLDCWQDFETQAPSTFAAMYQFWVHKPATCSDGTTANPRCDRDTAP